MIKRLVVCVMGLIVSLSAFAVDYQPTPTQWQYGGTGWKTTAEAACKMRSSTIATWVVNPSYYVYECHMEGWSPTNLQVVWACPYGGNLLSDPARNNEKWCMGGDGPPPPCPQGPLPGTTDVTTAYATGPKTGAALAKKIVPDGGIGGVRYCSNGCIIAPSGTPTACYADQEPGVNGYFRLHCDVPMKNIGTQCAPGPADASPNGDEMAPEPGIPPEPVTPNTLNGSCPAGSIPSGQDSMGMTICVGTAKPPTPPTTTTEKPEVTTQNPDGSTTSKRESTATNSDGSTTTTTTTTVTAADGTKTITVDATTSPRPTGEAGSQDKPEDKSDLCKQNPNLNVCKNSQVMGTCGEITCNGDAIQCATARAAAAMECKQREDSEALGKSALYTLGSAAANGNDPATLPGPKNALGITMPSSLDGSGWLGGGAPFPDKTFTVQGQTITIPFSQAVSYLIVLRYALMIVALLVSFRILSGAIIRE